MNIFAEELKTYRKAKGLSQKDISVILGCSPASMSFYESGQRCPPLKKIKEYCKKLKIKLTLLDDIPPDESPIEPSPPEVSTVLPVTTIPATTAKG